MPDDAKPHGAHGLREIAAYASDAINAAALGQADWKEVCSRIVECFPGSYAAMLNQNTDQGHFNFAVSDGIDPALVEAFTNYYAVINPWRKFWQYARSGQILVAQRDDPADRYQGSEFYDDWMKRVGDFDAAVGLRLKVSPDEVLYFPVHYSARLSSSYDSLLEELMGELAASMTNAYHLAQLMRDAGEKQIAASALIDRNKVIAVVIDSRLRIVDTNQSAQKAFAIGYPVACRQGRIRFFDHRVDVDITKTLHDAEQKNRQLNQTFFSTTPEQRWVVKINQLPTFVTHGLVGGRTHYLCQISLPSEILHDPDTSLLAEYGLTPKEIALCRSLASGRNLSSAAADTNISYENARQRLKSIFRKAEVRTQAELRVLLSRL